MSVFKYSERKWSELLLSCGGVRIGTLYDFRKDEHKRGVLDKHEGTKKVFHEIKKYSSNVKWGVDHAAVEKFGFIKGDGYTLADMRFERDFDASDCYVHCTAHLLSQSVMDEFDKADSCVEIFKVGAFYRRLTDVLNKINPVHFYGVHKITYGERDELFNGENFGVRPDLIKALRYKPQCEMRAIWIPKSKKRHIAPLNIEDKSLIKYCREVTVT